jgi:hypothetical protein
VSSARAAWLGTATLVAALGCGSAGGGSEDLGASVGAGGASSAGSRGQAGQPPGGAGGAEPARSDDAGAKTAGRDAETPSAGDGGAAGPIDAAAACSRFVTEVVDHAFGPGQSTGQDRFPEPILGPPRGAGCCSGSFDVVALGNGGSVTVAFGRTVIVDEPGPDFTVFENAFNASGDPTQPFAELGTVSVSEDGETWVEFPCTATAYPYGSCAGWHAVFANADQGGVDPLDPAVSGGDLFDLADIGVERARYVRIVDRPDLDGFDGVFDLDAVGVVHAACP